MEKKEEQKENWELVEVPTQMALVFKKGEEILNERDVLLRLLNNSEKILKNLEG